MRGFFFGVAVGLGVALFPAAVPASAAVVSDAGVSFRFGTISNLSGTIVPAYQIGVAQALGGSDIDTSTWFTYETMAIGESTLNVIRAINHNLDEGSDWYAAPTFDRPFTPATIAADQFTPLVVGDTFSAGTFVNATFYLAFDTGLQPSPTRGEAMGWVRLRAQDGVLTLLGSAVAYGEPGIYIGRATAVPEPAAGVAGAAAAAAFLRRRVRRSRPIATAS